MGGGGGAQTIIESPLPDYAQVYVEDYLTRAGALSLEAYTPYSGTTYAPRNSNESNGIAAIATRATAGHPIVTKGHTLIRAELNGDKFNVNPKLAAWFQARVDEAIQEFKEETLPMIERQCLLAGRFGGGAHAILQFQAADKLTKRLALIAEDTWPKDTFDEKERQVAALSSADNYGTEDIRDAEMLRQAGLYEREYYQGLYDDAFRKWKEEELADVKRLEILGNAIRACVGAQVTTTVPYYRPKPFAQLAGVATVGVGLYASFYGKMKSRETRFLGGGTYGALPGTTENESPNKWGATLDYRTGATASALPEIGSSQEESDGLMSLDLGEEMKQSTNPDIPLLGYGGDE